MTGNFFAKLIKGFMGMGKSKFNEQKWLISAEENRINCYTKHVKISLCSSIDQLLTFVFILKMLLEL